MNDEPTLLLREVSVGERLVDVVCDGDIIASVGPPGRHVIDAEVVVEGKGRPVIPGLHDHHIHLLATAAARRSVVVGPPEVNDRDALVAALRNADQELADGEWIRCVGYHESVAGDLDREGLDALITMIPGCQRPVRIQHRSGALWILDTRACDVLGLSATDPLRTTGRLWRQDDWLRERLGASIPPDVAELGADLASLGVTGVTDATPFNDHAQLLALADSARSMPQKIHVMGGVELAGDTFPDPLIPGPVKVVIADHELPSLDDLATAFFAAHDNNRCVAVHCVTRVALVMALAAWDQVGARDGDRIEHGSVIPKQLTTKIADLGLRVVTQPNFISERGDQYLAEVTRQDLDDLYRVRSLIDSGVRVAGSTDSPYGNFDPWKAIAAAINRRTPTGAVLGCEEVLDASDALGLFLSSAHDPGGQIRSVAPGQPSDLVVLNKSLPEVLRRSDPACVAVTIASGAIIHQVDHAV